MLRMIGFMALSTVLKGANTVAMKKAQSSKFGGIRQSLYFTFIFCAMQAVLLLFLPPYSALSFSVQRLWLPALFGAFYFLHINCMVLALREGPTSLTIIIHSFNSLFPIVFGLIFWNETMGVTRIIGLALFLVALLMFNSGTYQDSGEAKPITLRWAILALLTMAFGGMAVLCTKQYMVSFDGYIKEYLIVYAIVCVLLTLPFALHSILRHRDTLPAGRGFYMHTALAAVTVDGSNIIFMMYITRITSALYFPLTSLLSILAVVLVGRFVLGEKISRRALVGIGLSAVALVLLGL